MTAITGMIGNITPVRDRAATLFNRSPLQINENIPGTHPAYFILDAPRLPEQMTCQVIYKAKQYIYIDSDRPQLERDVDSVELASAVIEGLMASWPMVTAHARPAFFFAEGTWTVKVALHELAGSIKQMDELQMNWFNQLLFQADAFYARANRDPRVITILHREAAERLGAKREWAIDLDPNKRCPFCAAPVVFNAVICRECKEIINVEAYKRLKSELGGEAVEAGTRKGTISEIERTTEPQITSNIPNANIGGAINAAMIKAANTRK